MPDALCDFLEEFCMPGPSEDGLPDGPPSSAACPEPVATPHPKRTVACEVACEEGSEVAWADAAALSLQENGFVVLRASTAEPLIDAATCEECRRIAAAQLARLFALLRGRGVDPRRDRFTFGEVCARTAGGRRPDMRLPTEGSEAEAWSPLLRAVDRWVRPVLERSQLAEDGPSGVRVDGAGCVTALPGAPEQHLHPDGTARGLVNCFAPLVRVDAANGPTELAAGSHHAGACEEQLAEDCCFAAPHLLPGELLLFDYRVLHRGRANCTAEPRPVAYVTYSTRRAVSDQHNFPADRWLLPPATGSASTTLGHDVTQCEDISILR